MSRSTSTIRTMPGSRSTSVTSSSTWRIARSVRRCTSRSVGVTERGTAFAARKVWAALAASVAVVLACTATTLLAQPTGLRAPPARGFGAVAGVVDDSLRGGALRGATVALIGTSLRTTTDQDGFFRLDSIPPGEAQLAVLHPLLDTLFLA